MTDPARPIVWRAYEHVAMVLGLGFLALLCLVWLPFAFVLNPLLPRAWGEPVGRRLIMVGFRIYLRFLGFACACRFDLAELDALRHEGPLVLVANHPSLLDAVMIVSRLPNAVCVMKAALMANPLFGAAARLARYIPNDAPIAMVLKARDQVAAGAHLLIFPEGTRTTSFPVDACTPAAGLVARRAGAPIQSLLIESASPSSPYLGKHWPLFRKPALPLNFRVRLGRRFAPPADAAAFAREIEGYFRAELQPLGSAAPIAREAVS